jgi:hypothetical protein
MGWFNYHLWEFTIGKQRYGLRQDDDVTSVGNSACVQAGHSWRNASIGSRWAARRAGK